MRDGNPSLLSMPRPAYKKEEEIIFTLLVRYLFY